MTDLVVHAHGEPGAPELLLLHGLGDSGSAWADAVARWSPTYRVLAPDLLGHGTSPRFTPEQLAADDPLEEMYDALVRAVEAHATGPAVAVGHSMGGGLAAALGARRPDLVRGLVLEDPAWMDGPPWGDEVTRERVADARAAADDLEAEVARGRRELPTWPAAELRPWAEAKTRWDLGFGATGRSTLQVPWREVAAAITAPTLLVTGTGRVLVDGALRAAVADVGNPVIEVVVVEGAGHCVRRERTEAFHAVVDPWLARVTAARGV